MVRPTSKAPNVSSNLAFGQVAALLVERGQVTVEQATTMRATCKDADAYLRDVGTAISLGRTCYRYGRGTCTRCSKGNSDVYPFSAALAFGTCVCSSCWQVDPGLRVITKTLAKEKYCLTAKDLADLPYICEGSYNVMLLRERIVRAKAVLRYGSDVEVRIIRKAFAQKAVKRRRRKADAAAHATLMRQEYLYSKLRERGILPTIWGIKAEMFVELGTPTDNHALIQKALARRKASYDWHFDVLAQTCHDQEVIRAGDLDPLIIREIYRYFPTNVHPKSLEPFSTLEDVFRRGASIRGMCSNSGCRTRSSSPCPNERCHKGSMGCDYHAKLGMQVDWERDL
jgi:hypothetical protein